MNRNLGPELSLLDGMDEHLLVNLVEHGITTRAELRPHVSDPARRKILAERLGVSPIRLEAIHHLNFLLPEERVARLVALERRVEEIAETARRGTARMGWGLLALALIVAAGFVSVLVLSPSGPSAGRSRGVDAGLRAEIDTLKLRLEGLAPLARAQAESELHAALLELGPAPGWSGPISWTEERHRALVTNLGHGEESEPARAVSLALVHLARLESAGSGSVRERAERAAAMLEAFPPVGEPQSLWDAAAALIRLRLYSRSLGLASLESLDGDGPAVDRCPWDWTSVGFLRSEMLLARVESLPLRREVIPVWSETLVAIRREAEAGEDALGERPEAFARDYWIRRSELELTIVVAALGRNSMLPYARGTPRAFLADRRRYLDLAITRAQPSARIPLRWLALEHEAAESLLAWLAGHPETAGSVNGLSWLEAMTRIAALRATDGEPAPDLTGELTAALTGTGERFGDPWKARRTVWEAGLRPLLMVPNREPEPAPPDSTLEPEAPGS